MVDGLCQLLPAHVSRLWKDVMAEVKCNSMKTRILLRGMDGIISDYRYCARGHTVTQGSLVNTETSSRSVVNRGFIGAGRGCRWIQDDCMTLSTLYVGSYGTTLY